MLTEYKKNRFHSNYNDNLYANDDIYQVYDFKTDDRWFIHKNINNLYEDDLGVILNNLYERNGYLRQECSKSHKILQKSVDRYYTVLHSWSRLNHIVSSIQEIITYKELPDLIKIAELHITDPQKYYQILFTTPDLTIKPNEWINPSEFINKIKFDDE